MPCLFNSIVHNGHYTNRRLISQQYLFKNNLDKPLTYKSDELYSLHKLSYSAEQAEDFQMTIRKIVSANNLDALTVVCEFGERNQIFYNAEESNKSLKTEKIRDDSKIDQEEMQAD